MLLSVSWDGRLLSLKWKWSQDLKTSKHWLFTFRPLCLKTTCYHFPPYPSIHLSDHPHLSPFFTCAVDAANYPFSNCFSFFSVILSLFLFFLLFLLFIFSLTSSPLILPFYLQTCFDQLHPPVKPSVPSDSYQVILLPFNRVLLLISHILSIPCNLFPTQPTSPHTTPTLLKLLL